MIYSTTINIPYKMPLVNGDGLNLFHTKASKKFKAKNNYTLFSPRYCVQ